MNRLLLTILIIITPALTYAKEADTSYLCIEDQSVGFLYDEGTNNWTSTNFTAIKHIIKKPKEGETWVKDALWIVSDFGSSLPSFHCVSDFDKSGLLACYNNRNSFFHLNKLTLKFVRSYSGTYTQNNKWRDTPIIAIGKCSPI